MCYRTTYTPNYLTLLTRGKEMKFIIYFNYVTYFRSFNIINILKHFQSLLIFKSRRTLKVYKNVDFCWYFSLIKCVTTTMRLVYNRHIV